MNYKYNSIDNLGIFLMKIVCCRSSIFIILCVHVSPACMSVYPMIAVPTEDRRVCLIPWD